MFASLFCLVSATFATIPYNGQQILLAVEDDNKVPVHLAVQSRDPDSVLCENIFDAVLKRVSDKVELELVYVGDLSDEEPDFGIVCPQGPQECVGNIHQLCAAKHTETFAQFWEFIHCSNFQGRAKIGTLDAALKCANSAQFDWYAGAADCAGDDGRGEEGVALLKASVQESKQMGLEQSCTILISEEPVCVRDGTWKQCEGGHTANDFVRQINSEYERINTQ